MLIRALVIYILAIIFVCIIIGLAIQKSTTPANSAEAVDVAIVFCVDVSGSMNNDEVMVARGAHVAALTSPDVLTAIADGLTGKIAVAYVEFGRYAKVGVDWTIIDGPASAAAFAIEVSRLPLRQNIDGSETAIGKALLTADELLGRAPPAVRLVVDVVGDGVNTGIPHPKVGQEAILSRGATINGMPVLMAAPDMNLVPYYKTWVAGGPAHFVMPVDGVDSMPMALRQKIVQELF